MKHLLLTTIAAVLLVGCGPPKPPDISIHQAANDGNIEAIKQHLATGTDVNAKAYLGMTPLHLCGLSMTQKEIAELLIAAGADVNAKRSDDGWTALNYATSDRAIRKPQNCQITQAAPLNANTCGKDRLLCF